MSKDPSFAWIYAVSVFQPKFIMAETGLSRQELQDFSTWICSEFFQKTADLLKKAKNVDSVTDYWATLNENLTTIYLLARYINFEPGLERLVASSARLASHPKILASVKSLVEGCEDVTSHPKATLATREKMARRIENAFGIFGEILFNENMVDEIITGDSDELDHLQSYTQHWLEKLGEGPVPYSQMIVKIFQLNTLCRIDFRDDFEERGEYPPEFYQQRVQRIVSEASTKLESLTPKTRDRLESIPKLFRQIFAATEPHYAQFECHSFPYRWTSAWTMRAPNFFGDVTAILLSEKFLNKGRAPRILTLGDITRMLTPGNITYNSLVLLAVATTAITGQQAKLRDWILLHQTFRPPKFTTDRTTH